jgi:hypothetical protein
VVFAHLCYAMVRVPGRFATGGHRAERHQLGIAAAAPAAQE